MVTTIGTSRFRPPKWYRYWDDFRYEDPIQKEREHIPILSEEESKKIGKEIFEKGIDT